MLYYCPGKIAVDPKQSSSSWLGNTAFALDQAIEKHLTDDVLSGYTDVQLRVIFATTCTKKRE